MTIYTGYIAFTLCEAFSFSGVIAVLLCGVIMSHYMTYNLSKASAHSSK
jgi:sodium/hydrogen exchanger 8